MSVSPTILLITLALGVPLMLLALGVLYHAYLFSRQPLDLLDERVESLATESAEELLMTLQMAVEEMQGQMAHQRETLAGMLSEPRPAFAMAALSDIHGEDLPLAAGEFVEQSHQDGPQDMRSRVARLAEEGLSDRAIARQLHVGLEEVRIARMRGRS